MDPYWSAVVQWRTRCTRDTQTWITTSYYPYRLQYIWLPSMQHAVFYFWPHSYNGDKWLRSLCSGFLPHAWSGFYSRWDCLECCIDRHILYVSFLFSGLLATFSPETSSQSECLNGRFLTIWKHNTAWQFISTQYSSVQNCKLEILRDYVYSNLPHVVVHLLA
jgi:hypothetical protein